MGPSPFVPHQWASSRLFGTLFAACPAGFRVFHAPLDVRLSDDTVVQPDLLVVRATDTRGKRLSGLPLLVVEVLSDSTRGVDLMLERARYERAGVPSYWVVGPDSLEVTVWEIGAAGEYAERVPASPGEDGLTVDRPFPVTLRLSR